MDEAALGDEDALAGRDRGGLLRSLAGSGALVRTAAAQEADRGIGRLRDGGRPRAVLVADDSPGASLFELLRATSTEAPVVAVDLDDGLPRWAGAGDALLLASCAGDRPELSGIAGAAGRRGLAMAAAAPAGSPLAHAAGAARATIAAIPDDAHPRAVFWALAAPLLQALDALGAASVPPWALGDAADALDAVALVCRVGADVLDNPAKMLAIELAESRPVIAGRGALGVAAARDAALALALAAGAGSVVGSPERDLPALLAALGTRDDADDEDDFFRDRLADPPLRPRLILARAGGRDAEADAGPSSALGALLAAAAARHVRVSELLVEGQHPIAHYAAATLFAAFAAAYLALGQNLDPSGDPLAAGTRRGRA